MFKNKKGDVAGIVIAMIIIFFLAVSFVVVIFVNDKFTDVVRNTQLNDTSVSANIISHMEIMSTSTVNNAFMFIFGAMAIGMLLTSFFARNHPIWFFVYFWVTAICIVVAAPLANMYQTLIEADAISATLADNQTMINYIMQHFVQIIIVLAVLCAIVAFTKPEQAFSGGVQDI